MPDRRYHLLFTCEHASNRIPHAFEAVARRAGSTLKTHRGFDPGTAALGRLLAGYFRAPLIVGKWSRLLIELNRSPRHPRLWSEYSRSLPDPAKATLLEDCYKPYREAAESAVRKLQTKNRGVLHLSLHSFTPLLKGQQRRADIGLLYDPGRAMEAAFCGKWKTILGRHAPAFTVRRNYPYRGVADGLTTHLRAIFPADRYLGVELELNQKFPLGEQRRWRSLMRVIKTTLQLALADAE